MAATSQNSCNLFQKRVDCWLKDPFDEETKKEVRELQKNPQALKDAFCDNLAFGTGGLRALMGVGTNRLNRYTIRLATQALANYLKKQGQELLSVVIGFDSRHHSELFAQEAARVLAGNQIRAYLLPELRPTPFVSFACRAKKASAAIMITASHNPKDYNGYKVYWSDGAQVVPPHDTGIMKEFNQVEELENIPLKPLEDPLVEQVDLEPLDQAYLQAIAPLAHCQEENLSQGKQLRIVYTSLHGTGITLIPRALKSWGFSSVDLVKNQVTIDPNFSTVPFPNPEHQETLKLATEQLIQSKADIALASDPDADRLGAVVLHQDKPFYLNGNEIAALCAEFLCQRRSSQDEEPAIVTTIVTTELLKSIAKNFDVCLVEVLTGFKYIGEKIHQWETEPQGKHLLFGAEESYGYLIGTHARDKDAIVISCLLAEIALQAKLEGETLVDKLHHLYKTYGIFREAQLSYDFPPNQESMQKMKSIMKELREHPPASICGQEVLYIEDYKVGKRQHLKSGQTEELSLPSSNVLLFRLADQSRLVIRPSGTEPKIKIYAGVQKPYNHDLEQEIQLCDTYLNKLTQTFFKCLNSSSSQEQHLA